MTELNTELTYGWLRACDEELINLHIGVANLSDSYTSAKEKLRALIDLHITIATDPSVNGGYKLVPIETSEAQQVALPLSDEQIESLREKTFSTGNPYCPVDSKSMRKAARAIEAHHGIK